jgi:hypothetical protein
VGARHGQFVHGRWDGPPPAGDRGPCRRVPVHWRPPIHLTAPWWTCAVLKVNEINVETFKGVVQLSGFVRSQADINQAVKVARGVAGVKSVKNDMRIK